MIFNYGVRPIYEFDSTFSMDDVTKADYWRNLVVFADVKQWIDVLSQVWNATSQYSPRYYEVRCSFEVNVTRFVGLDFRFYSPTNIEKALCRVMKKIGIPEEFYDIDPKQQSDDKAKIFAGCSGTYKSVITDTKHTSSFLEFLMRVADLAVDFLQELPEMTCENPASEEPRNEVSHLFRTMMGIQDGLDKDTTTDELILYDSVETMLQRAIENGTITLHNGTEKGDNL